MPSLDVGALILQTVPQHWWPLIGMWLTRAFALVCTVQFAAWTLYKLDALDGHENKYVANTYRISVAVTHYALAIVEMLPVQLPFVSGLRRMKDLAALPHADDVTPEAKP